MPVEAYTPQQGTTTPSRIGWEGEEGLLQDARLRGVLVVSAPRPGVWWELCRTADVGGGMSSFVGGVIWFCGQACCKTPD